MSQFDYCQWENLPSVVLVQIYSLLENNDKYHLALTCRAWSQNFSRPEVWHNAQFHFQFNGEDDCRTLRFPASLALGMCHLTIECQHSKNYYRRREWNSPGNLNTFLERLVTIKASHLVTLNIVVSGYLCQEFHWFTEKNLLVLRELISMQTCLKNLDLTGADLDTKDGIDLLKEISSRCGGTIAKLSIDGFFREPVTPDNLWQNFKSLTDLTLSYQYLSDYFLIASLLPVSGSLMRLTVFAKGFGLSPSHFLNSFGPLPIKTSTGAWEELRMSNPSLEAHFCLNKEASRFNCMRRTLVPGIPLVSLEFIWSGGASLSEILTHITSHFKDSLKRLVLVLEKGWVGQDHLLDEIIERCVHLEEISLTATTASSRVRGLIVESAQSAMDRQPTSRLKRFTFNGEEIELSSIPEKY